jgi:hypothetical protein
MLGTLNSEPSGVMHPPLNQEPSLEWIGQELFGAEKDPPPSLQSADLGLLRAVHRRRLSCLVKHKMSLKLNFIAYLATG